MLTRSKVVLAALQVAKKPLSSLVLTKLVFLLKEEADLSSVAGFYNFVPYRFGPYSFALRNELCALQRHGYIEESDDTWRLGQFVDPGRDWLSELDPHVAKAVRFTVDKRGPLGRAELLKYVYRRHPWFASGSELASLVPDNVPQVAKAERAVYTVGYQQKTVDGFLAALLASGIEGIVDVRSNPVSRNYGFAGRTLATLSGNVNLDYHHVPELGIPSAKRQNLDSSKKYADLFADYRDNILPERQKYIENISDLMTARASTLMCYEADPECCHRRPLAEAVSRKTGLPIVDLP